MKNLLKTIILIILPLTFITAQEDNDKQEVGVRMNTSNQYDLFYKNQIGENKYFRLRTVNAYLNKSDSGLGTNVYNIGFGLATGIEKRKELTDEFEMILGWEALASIAHRKFEESSQGNYRLGLGFVLGFNYKLTKNINIGIETIPSITYSSSYGGFRNPSSINIGLNSSNINFTGMYSF